MRFSSLFLVTLLNLMLLPKANSQWFYKPGQVVTSKGDTLYGYLSPRVGQNSLNCKFRQEGSNQTATYSPAELKSCRFKNGNYYITQEIRWKDSTLRIFSEVLLDGFMCLTTTNKTRGTKYYIKTPTGEFHSLPLMKKNLARSYYYNLPTNPGLTFEYYKDTLAQLFKSSRRTSQLVSNIDYTRNSLMNITETFIKETCKDDNCILYKKDLRFSGPKIGFYGSIPFSIIRLKSSGIHSGLVPGYAVGLFRSDPLPRISDKLSFRMELLIRRTEFRQGAIKFPTDNNVADIRYWSVGLPVMLQYHFQNRSVSPSVSLGKEFSAVPKSMINYGSYSGPGLYLFSGGGWLAEIGLDSYKTVNGNWFLSYRFQYFENGIVFGSYSERFTVFTNTLNFGFRF